MPVLGTWPLCELFAIFKGATVFTRIFGGGAHNIFNIPHLRRQHSNQLKSLILYEKRPLDGIVEKTAM
eukprot:430392-Pleurochrysis_carterae.AAC.2